MAILDFNTTNAAPSKRMPFGGINGGAEERPVSNLWLNIGYEINGKFVNLPLGMPIDTMKPAEIRGQNEDFVKLRTAQNALLKALQDLGATFAPGQEQDIQLTVKLRRVNGALDISKTENEYSVDLDAMLVKPAPTMEAAE